MTVHMFRVYIGKGDMAVSDLESRINDWVSSNLEWEADTMSHELREKNTQLDGSGSTYYHTDVRFEQSDTKANLLQKLADKLENKVSWYWVGYHECTDDESIPQTCTFDPADSTEWEAKDVSIPAGVPVIA